MTGVLVVAPRAAPGTGGAASVKCAGPGALTHALRLAPYVGLLALIVVLALARLETGPWYQTYNARGVSLLEGWPVAWETEYYLSHVPSFISDAPARAARPAMTLVHTRTFVNLYLAALLTAWSGSVFWSFALVDVAIWFAGAVASYHFARRMGARAWPAALTALMVAASPILVSNMWRHDLHAANFATMPIGLWAAATLADEERDLVRLTGALAFLLFLLSVSYQYQWIMVPVLAVLLAFRKDISYSQRAAVLGGSLALYVVGAALFRLLLDVSGFAVSERTAQVVSQPGQLALGKLAGARSPADLLAILPGPELWIETAMTFHPITFVLGVLGLLLAPARTRMVALAASAAALGSISLYPAPWTAMSAYPLIYLGVGLACDFVGRAAGGMFDRTVGRRTAVGRAWGARQDRPAGRVALVIGASIAVALCGLSNLDVVGDPRFLLMWWRYYAEPPLF